MFKNYAKAANTGKFKKILLAASLLFTGANAGFIQEGIQGQDRRRPAGVAELVGTAWCAPGESRRQAPAARKCGR